MGKILLVDDDPDYRDTIRGILEDLISDCEVLEDAGGKGCYKRISELDFNNIWIIFLDGNLGKVPRSGNLPEEVLGWKVAEIARNKGYSNEIIHIGSGNVPETYKNFYDGFVFKDNPEKIIEAINNYVANPSSLEKSLV